MDSMIMYHPIREFCRGCLSNNNLAPMNQTRLMHQEGLMLNVWPAFLEISGVNGFFENCPPLICNACVTSLETVVRFRRNAQRTDEVLKNILLPGVQAITINASTQTPNRAPMRDAFTQVGQAVGYKEVAIQTEGGLYDFEPQSPIYPEAHETTTSESLVNVVERDDSSASTLCYVSHINSPSNFFVQFAKESGQLESVSQTLDEIDLEPLSSDQIESGVRCVAKYPVDGYFYRAEILSVLNDGQFFVTFSDYGNTSPVTDLRKLPESLTFPSLAIACKLDLPAGKVWAKWATKLFVEMAQNGDTEFEIEVLEDGERCLVKLSVDDENVGDSLMMNDEPRRSLVLEPVLEEAEDESEDEEANTDDAASVIEAPLRFERVVDASNQTIAEEDGDGTEKSHDVPAKDESTGSSNSTEGCDKAQVVSVNSLNDFHVTIQENEHDLSRISLANIPMARYHSRGPKFDGLLPLLPSVDEESVLVTPRNFEIVPKWPKNMSNNHVYITCVVNPGIFYVHTYARSAQYEAMMERIMNVAPYQQSLVRFSEGTMCFLYRMDGWHRAQILKEGKYALEVLSIDLGRIDYVAKINKKSSLRVMPKEIAEAESFAECCSLYIEPLDGDEWCGEAMHLFGGLQNQVCEAGTLEMNGLDEERTYIELIYNSINVAEELVSRGFALSLVSPPEAVQLPELPSNRVTVLSFTSINNFQVLFINPSLMAYIRQTMMTESDTFETLVGPPSINSIVAARQEEHFYRAQVLSAASEEGGFYVEFLDFGQTAVCTEFRQLPENLSNIPALAIRCRLANESGMLWTVQKTERFHNLCLAHEWFDIRVIEIEDRWMTVQLYHNGRAIDEMVEAEFTPIADT